MPRPRDAARRADDLGGRAQRRADRDRACAEAAVEEVAEHAHARSGGLPDRDVAHQHRMSEQARRVPVTAAYSVGVEREPQAVADDRLMQRRVALGQREPWRGEASRRAEVVEVRRGDARASRRRPPAARAPGAARAGGRRGAPSPRRPSRRRRAAAAPPARRRRDGRLHALRPAALVRRSPRTRRGSARPAPGGSPTCRRTPTPAPHAPTPPRRARRAARTTARRRRPPRRSAPRPAASPARPAIATRSCSAPRRPSAAARSA